MHRYLGIDPGLRYTGWGIISMQDSKLVYIGSGVINLSKYTVLTDRLRKIFRDLKAVAYEYKPDFAAIENTYVNVNSASSLKLAHARAAAILAVAESNLDTSEYPAKTIKKTICGNGNAEKEQINHMLKYLLPKMAEITNADEADAIAIAICHAHHI